MIFTPEHCDMILRGEKTQTRRVMKSVHSCLNWWRLPLGVGVGYPNICDIGVVQCNGRDLWQMWNTYALQPGRGKSAVGRIRIMNIRLENLKDISRTDAQAEGYSRFDFEKAWDSINTRKGTRWADNPAVWVLTFEVVKGQA